jgi:hypothetical protein
VLVEQEYPFRSLVGKANSGNPSIFSTITSAGGGGGSYGQVVVEIIPGVRRFWRRRSGANSGTRTGGSGNTPPVAPPQGNSGGGGTEIRKQLFIGGGGGGQELWNAGTGQPSSLDLILVVIGSELELQHSLSGSSWNYRTNSRRIFCRWRWLSRMVVAGNSGTGGRRWRWRRSK